MSRMLLPLLILALLASMLALPLTQAVAQSVFIDWEQRYDGGNFDAALAVAVDSDDNVIVTGCSEIRHVYHVANETVGTGNGTDTNFTLDHYPVIVGSETIYLNGDPQKQEKHQANETVGTGNGTETNFTLDHHLIIVGSETIYLDGNQTTNYTIDYQNGTITFTVAPGTGVVITADYDYTVYTIDYDNGTITFTVAPEAGIVITAVYDYEAANYDYYTIKYDSAGSELWNKTYDSGGSDEAHGIAVDLGDNIIVTGYCDDNYHTIKYTPNGTELWNRTYNSGTEDRAFAVAVDSTGNITVTGRSANNYYTIKYDANGTELWNRTYNGTGADWANGVAVDSEDNIIVTGYSMNVTGTGTNDYYTIKYAPNGTEIWNATYDSGGHDCAQAIAVDSQDNIVVTGAGLEENSTWYYCTIKYYPDGAQFWTQPVTYHSPYTYRASGENVGTGDGSKTVFTLGYHPIIAGSEKIYLGYVPVPKTDYTINYATGKITFDTAPKSGVAITADYTALAGATAFGAAVDTKDNIIITGRGYYLPYSITGEYPNIVFHPEISNCYCTIKYSPDGDEIWSKTYDRVYPECAYSVAVDSEDNIIVTGKVSDGKTWNYLTIKYAQLPSREAGGVSGSAIAVIVIMASAVVGGTGYYFFIRRKKAA